MCVPSYRPVYPPLMFMFFVPLIYIKRIGGGVGEPGIDPLEITLYKLPCNEILTKLHITD